MTYQEQSNGYVAFKEQSGLGAQASGGSAIVLRTTGGAGGKISKAAIESKEVRQDGMSTRGRHGTRKTNGAYSSELSLGLFDPVLQAVMRGTWSAANLAITQSAMTSVTTGAHTIVAAAGSWITEGLRVGDVIRATGLPDAGNNGRNLRITGLTALTITVAETLTVNAGADTSFTITRPGRVLINPTSRVKKYFTVEEHELDIDGSEIFTDVVWSSLKFSMQPDGLVMCDSTWLGTGQSEVKSGGSAPHFTSPTTPTGIPLAATEATVRKGSTDLLDMTAFDLSIDIGASAPPVIAPPSTPWAPDVFSGAMQIGMNITTLRKDLLDVADFLDETPLSLSVLLTENESEPEDFVSIYVPNFTLGGVDKSALAKEGGPRTQTMAIPSSLVGIDSQGGAFDPTMIKIQVSNAS